jgi:organic radical activating enzyme
MTEELDPLVEWRNTHLDSVSKSFCAAKWLNASLHLGHGFTNSCHLPLPHPIDLEEIKTNPSALHNTKFKKEIRKMMLEGTRPAECSYCWKVEDIGDNTIGDRVFKSRIYTDEEIKAISELPWNEDVNLKTVEVSFDRTCNFACSYCNAGYSTTWAADIEKNGPYQNFKTTSAGAYHADGSWADAFGKNNKDNPYVDAFIEWWPELSPGLQELRVTGGEPSASFNFWKFLERMQETPAPHLRLAVNSNLGVHDKLIDKLINMSKTLPIKEFDLYTSCEAFGIQAEYIRHGLDWDLWRKNLVRVIEEGNFKQVICMMTINSLCLYSITEFMDDMFSLKEKYGMNNPGIDLNILRWPAFMSPTNLPEGEKRKLHKKLSDWFAIKTTHPLMMDHERSQIERLISYIDVIEQGHVETEEDIEKHHHDFKSFYTQHDKRRGSDFRKAFPDAVEWYDSIEVDTNIPQVKVNDGRITHFEAGEYLPDMERRLTAVSTGPLPPAIAKRNELNKQK